MPKRRCKRVTDELAVWSPAVISMHHERERLTQLAHVTSIARHFASIIGRLSKRIGLVPRLDALEEPHKNQLHKSLYGGERINAR